MKIPALKIKIRKFKKRTLLRAFLIIFLAGLALVLGGIFGSYYAIKDELPDVADIETFRPKLPPAYADSAFVFLANIDPVLQLEVLGQVHRPRFVACDTMNFWISGKPAELARVLARVNMVLLNDEEARQLSGKDNLPAAAGVIRGMGPGAVVIKRGDAGALFFCQDGVFAAPAFPLESVVDPTGAGDSFAGGCMGWLSRTGDISPAGIRTALVVGSVLASFCVQDFSLDRFRSLDESAIRARCAALAELVRFEAVRF